MPADDNGHVLERRQADERREIDDGQQRDVRHREVRADEIVASVAKFGIEPLHHAGQGATVGLAERLVLVDQRRRRGMRVPPEIGYRHHDPQLDTPVPHVDQRRVERVGAEQRRLRMDRIEIAADRQLYT